MLYRQNYSYKLQYAEILDRIHIFVSRIRAQIVMAAQPDYPASMDHDGYRSEDEDSTNEDFSDQIPDVPDPVITIHQNPSLKHHDPYPRDAEDQGTWQTYIPCWTRPGYDDNIEVSYNGRTERPRTGDFWSMMRPALLPTDPRPTQYAQ
jgi:hypothetical protein